MSMSRVKRLVATAALGALVLTGTAVGGAAAAGAGEGTPGGLPQESCLGQISANGVLLLEQTPAERAALFGFDNAGEWNANQHACTSAQG